MEDITEMLRDSAAGFLAGRYDLAKLRGQIGQPRVLDRALWREMGALGWLGLGLPESIGGSGMGLREASVLAEQFGRSAFVAPYVATSVMPSALLAHAASSSLAADLAASLQRGDKVLSVAWQEHLDELDAGQPSARLTGGRISGRKIFVPAADSADLLMVSVVTDSGVAVVVVAADAEGLTRNDQAAGLGTASTLEFSTVPILGGSALLVGAPALAALQAALDAGRVALAAQLQGLAAGLLDRTLDHVKARVQFARPIGSFQAIQHRCVDLFIAVQLAGASWRHALKQIERGNGIAAVSAAKARCADVAQRCSREAIQMHGAMGFTEEVDVGLYVRAALHGYGWLGSPLHHRRRFLRLQDAAQLETFNV